MKCTNENCDRSAVIKIGTDVYECRHCGATYSGIEYEEAHPIKHESDGTTDTRYLVQKGKKSINGGEIVDNYEIYFCRTFVGSSLSYCGAVAKAKQHNEDRFKF